MGELPQGTNSCRYKVIFRKGRKHFVVRFQLPGESRWIERSTKHSRRRDAYKAAPSIIAGCIAKMPRPFSDIPADWLDFTIRYEAEHYLKRPGVWRTAAKWLTQLEAPEHVGQVSPAMLSRYAAKLRRQGLREATIKTYLKHIRAALGWAEQIELIAKAPRVRLPRTRGKRMKGRPIALEEFERMLRVVPAAVKASPTIGIAEPVEPLRRFMWGLWYTGLRLEEGTDLWWDRPDKIAIENLEGRRPYLRFPGDQHKGGDDLLVPLTPDAVAFYRTFPVAERTGRVFSIHGRRPVKSADRVGRLIGRCGKLAAVVVDQRDRRGKRYTKYASAHDFRRSFGSRWSLRLMPAVLQKLMRHKSIETTMSYYVHQTLEKMANEVWEAFREDELMGFGAEGNASAPLGHRPPRAGKIPDTL